MKVKISDKEQDRVNSAKKYYTEQGLTANVENLKVGDYIFTDGKDSVAFEYKTIQDFISSIQDNRVFNEAINQAENFDYHFVIIQGNDSERAKQISISKNYQEVTLYQYIGAINSLNRYTTVIQVPSISEQEAYYTMMNQAKKCLSNKPIVKRFPRKHKNPCFNWLCYCIYGINGITAEKIVRECNLHTKHDLDLLTMEDLTSIDGIGTKTAQRILDSL